jgi:hypothetical protein
MFIEDEVAALALAATILNKLNLGEIAYFSDYRQLVDYINSEDHSDPRIGVCYLAFRTSTWLWDCLATQCLTFIVTTALLQIL